MPIFMPPVSQREREEVWQPGSQATSLRTSVFKGPHYSHLGLATVSWARGVPSRD